MDYQQQRIIRNLQQKLQQYISDGVLEISAQSILNDINEIQEIERTQISHIWCTEDVIYQAKELGYEFTEDQALDVLRDVEAEIDSEIGINWNVIEAAVKWYVKSA